jgi:predicted RNA-binding Zn-ribbon protein involved in translation (DUF1610 family)
MYPEYTIKTKPEYDSLAWNQKATRHVVISEGKGAVSVVKLFQKLRPLTPIDLLCIDDTDSKIYNGIIENLLPKGIDMHDSQHSVLTALSEKLSHYYMGTQFYVAGREAFIWAVVDVLKQVGVQDKNVMKEVSGTLARSVYCVHCKTINQYVTHSIHTCTSCGLNLIVRDHFSRRMGAYMGYMVDAEEPGNIPESEEVYP